VLNEVRPLLFEKKRVNASKRPDGVRVLAPIHDTRIAEITPGRATSQQGLATTCKDPPLQG
jgi:hypothetical protein